MSVWFTSDLHIGHRLCAALREGYESVPEFFTEYEVGRHDEILAHRWDEHVRTGDQVWVLGDISAGGSSAQRSALQWLSNRPGEKHLLAGNHDGVHPMHRDSHKWQPEYLKVFASVQTMARRKIGGRDVLLSHFPYRGDHTEVDRYNQYRLRDEGLPLLHGHTHSKERLRIGFPTHGFNGAVIVHDSPTIHVGVDAWDLRPVHLDEIAEIVGQMPRNEHG
ncbi:serine/threonine protein phosphatase [Mycobacterium intracellulare]|uniref:metallophosphoesterase family protein n=1 Tax=Mycobacterium intracellulare TaxID=1767 RepID=UPI00192546B9|nr:metallophosphoesterase [Mycobacterium intracellulare]BCO56120.1 serine/threonine protein phosphatase [Mycobacterium intracellulare]